MSKLYGNKGTSPQGDLQGFGIAVEATAAMVLPAVDDGKERKFLILQNNSGADTRIFIAFGAEPNQALPQLTLAFDGAALILDAAGVPQNAIYASSAAPAILGITYLDK